MVTHYYYYTGVVDTATGAHDAANGNEPVRGDDGARAHSQQGQRRGKGDNSEKKIFNEHIEYL